MEKIKTNSGFKKIRKIIFRTIISLILLLLLVCISLSQPFVQTKIANYFTERINKDFGTKINIEQVAFTVFGGVKLKKVLILDHHKDTLIYAKRIKTSILDFNKLINGKLLFGDIFLDQFYLKVKNYKGETNTNLDLFFNAFNDGKPSSGNFLMKSDNIVLSDSRFVMLDYNKVIQKDLDFSGINAKFKAFNIKGPNVSTTINAMSFKDHRGIYVKNLTSDFIYTKRCIVLNKLKLKTNNSFLDGKIVLDYNIENGDFKDFNNRVIFDVHIDSSQIATNDIHYFYSELSQNKKFNIKTIIRGTLNDFYASNIDLTDNKSSNINGDVKFKNLFSRSPGAFYMNGNFKEISSNYLDLTNLLPNILGKKLPSSLQKIGQFNFAGKVEVSPHFINSDFKMKTALGLVKSDLEMSEIENIDNAKYKGNVVLENFNIGALINDKNVGSVSLDINVDGKGLKLKNINTHFNGDIFKFNYNGYNYSKILVNASITDPVFKGDFNINDPNLFMDFNGVLDLSKSVNNFDFHSKIDYANLEKLKLVNDSISIFKGDIIVKAKGTSIDDFTGGILITEASYQNKKDLYFIDYLDLNSSFDNDGVRSLIIQSPNAINGSVVGKYKFNQLQKIVENSLGSFYSNYSPNKVLPNQYLKFDLDLNSRVIEIFNPDISLANNTKLKGNISSESKNFKLEFASKKIVAYNNTLDNILVQVDNQNPLYNAYIQLDSLKTERYNIRDLSVINSFSNDTLQFRTEFKGGTSGKDFFNLNFFHTINKENNNVIGFNKSELQFKDYLWYLNENGSTEKSRIIFDEKLTNFSFDNLTLSHDDESVNLAGLLNGTKNKDLQLQFENVTLNKVIPDIDKFKFEGKLNGEINVKQMNAIFQPTSTLKINDFKVNDVVLGTMNLEIEGDQALKTFHLNSSIENNNLELFKAEGDIEIVENKTILGIDLNFEKFNVGVLSKIGGDAFNNIRGFVTGTARIDGALDNLDYNGRLFVSDAGLTIPLLNTDYVFDKNSVIDITQNKFIVRETNITDTKFNSKATVSGYIKHKQFNDWQLDLSIDTRRFLALNTSDSDDSAYFGSAFMNGSAFIKGPVENLKIKVDAESAIGTDIKIPINDAESVEDSEFIHFKSPQEKRKKVKETITSVNSYNGLELEFDLTINEIANIEVILNRESGHGMRGNGNGTLLFRINTSGKFEMFGDFSVVSGLYNFKYGGLIDKKFAVKKGGSIIWNGDPMAAVLNLEAVYKTTANPSVLINNPSFNRKVDVDVVVGVKGNLARPEPDFNINFPNVVSSLKSELQYKLDDKDTRQTQALYLLSTGSFLSPEGVNQNQLSNNLFEKASSLFSDIFSSDEDKISIAPEYIVADRTPGQQTDGRFGVTISSKINERITFNGKVGVPVGGITETAIVGDLELQYRVNADGTLNLKVFNKENDITYIGQGIGYTQGIGMSYEVDFDNLKELVNKIFKNAKIERASTNVNYIIDSTLPSETIQLKDKKEKKKVPQKSNQEAVPTED